MSSQTNWPTRAKAALKWALKNVPKGLKTLREVLEILELLKRLLE